MRRTPLARVTPLHRGEPLAEVVYLNRAAKVLPLRPVSKRRARENRQRAAMADRLWPDRREGTVLCAVPDCGQRADDLHEPRFRSRSGSITDPENAIPICRPHHDALTFTPESELGWAYAQKLLVHSWNDPDGAA